MPRPIQTETLPHGNPGSETEAGMIAYPVPFGYGVFPMPRAARPRIHFPPGKPGSLVNGGDGAGAPEPGTIPSDLPGAFKNSLREPSARLDLNHDSDNTPMWINAAAELQSAFRASPFRAASGMPNGSYSLSEAAAPRNMLRLACPACGRSGQYRIDRLLEEHGPMWPYRICGTSSRNARAAAACPTLSSRLH